MDLTLPDDFICQLGDGGRGEGGGGEGGEGPSEFQGLKCYYDQKNYFYFSLDFKTMLTKQ